MHFYFYFYFSPRRDIGFTGDLCFSPTLIHDKRIKTICGFDYYYYYILLFLPYFSGLWKQKWAVEMYKTSGQVLLSAGVSLIPNEKCILCDFAWPPFHDGCLWAKAGVYKNPLTEEAAASRRHFHYRCNNWHLGATGCSALTDRLGAGSLSGCMTLTSLPNCRTPGHLPPSSAHGLSKQRGNRQRKQWREALQVGIAKG